ncbi:thymidine kinase [Stylonychia lemnae]|uniref:thymidine kinase n=1 Tax=Stylonychia lemnae TaxID=5949 RepID=A0A078AN91_STYLE|nr:thymidine kinase [Stylonychia lemnae]|eukprot:CDW83371.1 thymidine kinase [Stylonychia lemnae]
MNSENINYQNQSINTYTQKGRIELILGPMFSGKSTELVRIIKRHRIAHKKCLIVKHILDDRYSAPNYLSTHDRVQMEAIACQSLINEVIKHKVYEEYDVIGIDEAQFFQDIVEGCETLAKLGKVVIVASLDGTYQRKPFGSLLNLIPLAEKVRKLSAICKDCFDSASFTIRIKTNACVVDTNHNTQDDKTSPIDNANLNTNITYPEEIYSSEDQIEIIGGEELYKPVCRQCYYRHTKINQKQAQAIPKFGNNSPANDKNDNIRNSDKMSQTQQSEIKDTEKQSMNDLNGSNKQEQQLMMIYQQAVLI